MPRQAKLSVCFNKININFFCGHAKLPLSPKLGLSPNVKRIFLRLSEWDDELLSTSKIITFLALPLSKPHQPALSNVIPYPLYSDFSLSIFLAMLVPPKN